MEYFHNAKSVRLRSYHGKYLCAEEDGMTVTQDRNGTHRNARWQVEFIEGRPLIRLKSCYNRYLTATDISFLLGLTGKKVLQAESSILPSSVEWEPVKDGPVHVILKTENGTYLRANRPWKNKITHDIPKRTITQYWVFWEVEVMEIAIPSIPSVVESPSPLPISPPSTPNGRVIYYAIGDHKGDIKDGYEWPSFVFRGYDVAQLTTKLEEETGLVDIIVCSRHPFTGKLYPLALELPPNNQPMHLVLLQPSSN